MTNLNSMTLREYLGQKDPQKQQNVVLTKKEYIVAHVSVMHNSEKRTRVYINSYNPLVAGREYCLIGTRFYTTDSDGNPKNRSCFKIES